MEARNLSWTGMDRLTNLLLGGGSSDDLMLASVMALHAVLLRPPLELRVRLVEALKQVLSALAFCCLCLTSVCLKRGILRPSLIC
jgi:hypothetical protein